jgi:galactokinase
MKEALHRLFRDHFGVPPTITARAPGRVNLIGEHTDYNDGFVLPAAISRQTMVAARQRTDRMVNIFAADLDGARTSFSMDTITPDAAAPWSNYIRGMASLLQAEGLALPGVDMAIYGDMPQGAGLSSSAALENASGLAFAALAGVPDFDRTRLAQIGQQTEHEFAGCKCGIMDQLVSARAVEGAALLIDCRTLATTAVAIPDDVTILIVHSGISRGLVDGAYNARRAQCEAAAAHYGVAALRDLEALPEQGSLDPVAWLRARHVITENARTLAASKALRNGDLAQLGVLMAQSHASMRDDFEITLPAIDQLVDILAQAIGTAGGARMTGGGFGGTVVAVLAKSKLDVALEAVASGYRDPNGNAAEVMIERASGGASLL